MIIHPENLADRGCWISGDRVYGFVSSERNGITVVGYHGAQPVSRNSWVFRGGAGAIRFAARGADGTVRDVQLRDFDWLPGTLSVTGVWSTGRARFSITASGCSLVITLEVPPEVSDRIVIVFRTDALTVDVHGIREWTLGGPEEGRVQLEFHDRILLDEWMKREGPYAGDFLIPEPLRRKIFRRRCRSGFATREDLLPEFVGSTLAIYDARVTVTLGGPGFEVVSTENDWQFVSSGGILAAGFVEFRVAFDEDRAARPVSEHRFGTAHNARQMHQEILDRSPRVSLPEHPESERFFGTVPGLLESCLVKEIGVPRATPGEYYWIWAWDAMVSALASLRWGDLSGAGRTAAFVDGHRDEGRFCPMRWTRSLEPLDTQPRGSLETLLLSLTYALAREGFDDSPLRALYPRMVSHLDDLARRSDVGGCFANPGFYPDLPLRFGRSEESAVAMEVGAFYTFCRTCENVALLMEDAHLARRAEEAARRIENSFLVRFWDHEKSFLIDSLRLSSGEANRSFPLFSLLFLHSPLGWPLIRPRLLEAAAFISEHLLQKMGMRLLPAWDRNAAAETVSGSWYPHWDIYALKILRRAGRSREIMIWLNAMEDVLSHLGFAPEFIMLDGLDHGDESAWLWHGAASNLNCATGWYQALIEGIFGLESDPGGLTLIPLSLPTFRPGVSGIRYGASRWDVAVENGGPRFRSLRVDGELMGGSLKIPSRFTAGGDHLVEVEYADQGPDRQFLELTNAELLEANSEKGVCEVRIRTLGRTEVVFIAPARERLFLDGEPVRFRDDGRPGLFVASVAGAGEHTLRLSGRG